MSENLNKLYNTVFDLIEIRLNKSEEVVPFLMIMENDGVMPIVKMADSVVENAGNFVNQTRDELINKLKTRQILGSCLCYSITVLDPRTNKKVDTVACELADYKGEAMQIYIPYNFADDTIIKKPLQFPPQQEYSDIKL